MKQKENQSFVEYEALRLRLQLDAFEIGIIGACLAQKVGVEVSRAHIGELGQIAKFVDDVMDSLADMDGLIVPPKAKRGIGFVVWMIARRRVAAAPRGWLKVMHSTRWEATEGGGRRAVHTTTYVCDETAP